MNPSANQFVKTLVLVVVFGYLLVPDSSEARSAGDVTQDEIMNYQRSIQQAQQELANSQLPMFGGDSSSLDRLDSDDEDDDDDRVQAQPGVVGMSNAPAVQTSGSDLYQTGQASYQPPLSVGDLRVAASKHHGHKHGAKGWLDMGAWTGKKGAFGWYDKHPVGKGK